jgi:hypothetical protein
MSCKIQKVVNLVAIASGVVSLTVVGSGVYVYLQRDQLIDNVKSQVLKSVTGSLPSLVDTKLPSMTGPASVPPVAGGAAGFGIPR